MPIALLLAIVLALILLNGFFAMAEMAIVAATETRLAERARRGSRGAVQALRLMQQPGRFLSSVQTGITLVGVLASAFSGATIAARFGSRLDAVAWIAPHGETVAFVGVVAAITFASVVLGELVPKRIALSDPEAIAVLVAPPLALLSALLRPAAWLLNGSSEALLRLMRIPEGTRDRATEEDLRHLLAEATRAHSIDPEEEAMVQRVIRLADRSVQTIMTPRIEVVWADLDAPAEEAARQIATAPHARVVAARGSIDRAEGAIRVRDLARALIDGPVPALSALVRPVAILPDTASIVAALAAFRQTPTHIALVIDEHGGLQGIVTPTDILEAIAGALAEDREPAEPLIRPHSGGYLVDGRTPVDELRTRLGIAPEVSADIQSAAGLVMDRLGHLPAEGDEVSIAGWRFEVLDMDGRRIDKLFLRAPRENAD
ncbi:hemolysin family protein [Actibacterium sp. MT2.3-13A]|uniref:hemolysin family protein n=1 Tax=Actibacterium sp. MT2.3-13A TaxID=2828332 RepID=UPI001BA56F40|nr:hemolysin family protein [Actibacterium sp. MT2.3-13A]